MLDGVLKLYTWSKVYVAKKIMKKFFYEIFQLYNFQLFIK